MSSRLVAASLALILVFGVVSPVSASSCECYTATTTVPHSHCPPIPPPPPGSTRQCTHSPFYTYTTVTLPPHAKACRTTPTVTTHSPCYTGTCPPATDPPHTVYVKGSGGCPTFTEIVPPPCPPPPAPYTTTISGTTTVINPCPTHYSYTCIDHTTITSTAYPSSLCGCHTTQTKLVAGGCGPDYCQPITGCLTKTRTITRTET